MKKEYILKVVFDDKEEEIELLTEYCDLIDCEDAVFEIDGVEINIPKDLVKELRNIDSDILGVS